MPDKDDIEEQETDKPVQRLCSEIQLFDLCDLERCSLKEGRYCTNGELLTRFERISEKDDTRPVSDPYLSEGPQDEEEADDDVYGDGLSDRDDDDRDDWEDE
ncbi:MAG: hypothetical protein P4L44_15635 [Oryzomonas sp.]|uniref:hypothetical protein n=1 Tax=Oryzomonas sp. TaxID=2855186 RepID=UPI0028461B6D|nr:hypothetical protein [Oryzomonas sp.]MDR3581392.1 hypothetical protein [Oryzomonas sp.]